MKKHNFSAGPSILPREVIENTAQAVLDFNGLSILEISHRSKDFQAVIDEAAALFKELLNSGSPGRPDSCEGRVRQEAELRSLPRYPGRSSGAYHCRKGCLLPGSYAA